MREKKLDFWIQNQLNVLFIGEHGVGKTAMVKDAFDRNNLKWRYFSASTMDPWVDFIGIPKEVKSEHQVESIDATGVSSFKTETRSHLELIRPADIASGEIEALFFDEFNRSPKKIRNAVMELIQFKSVNGIKFPNLKIVWAAINPDDENSMYDVDKLDPAQQDRFQVIQQIEYKPNSDWFAAQFGVTNAKAAIDWWKELADPIKKLVSPRRLEYALRMYEARGDMRDILPNSANVSKLTSLLMEGPITDRLAALVQRNDSSATKQWLSIENNYSNGIRYIVESETLMSYFLPLLSSEKISALIAEEKQEKARKHIINNIGNVPLFKRVTDDIVAAGTNKKMIQVIRRTATENNAAATTAAAGTKAPSVVAPYFVAGKSTAEYGKKVTAISLLPKKTVTQKTSVFESLMNEIPAKMVADDAMLTLQIISEIVADFPPSTLTSATYSKLPGAVSQCLSEIHRSTGESFLDMVRKNINIFRPLCDKMKEAALWDQVNSNF